MVIEKTETFIEHDIIVDDVKVGIVELCPERNEISRLIIFEPYQNKGYGTQVVQKLIQNGYKRGKIQMFEMVVDKGESEG